MSGYAIRAIDEMASVHHGAVKLAGAELGIRAFGMQVLDLPPGFADYPEHHHAEDGQEEVYIVLNGRAEFRIDGTEVPADAGQAVRVDATCTRALRAGPEGARILAIGRAPEAPYERPEGFRLEACS